MKPKLFILTGDIHTGKTTCLQNWAAQKNDVYGIISPIVNNERVFMNVQTNECCKMEATEGENETLSIGRYVFSKHSFEFAIATIQSGLKNSNGWVLIDECGPLELKGEGLHKVIKEVLSQEKSNLSIVIVVRNSILNEMITHYCINPTKTQVIQNSFFSVT